MLRVFWLLFVLPAAAQADELPKNLLLKCEGKVTVLTNPSTINVYSDPFSITLRLKDGIIGDIDHSFPDGKDCVLSNGNIMCELDRIVPADPMRIHLPFGDMGLSRKNRVRETNIKHEAAKIRNVSCYQ